MEQLLTVPEVAERIRASADYVRRLAQRRQLRHVKRGGRLLFTPADVQAWLDRQTVEAQPPRATRWGRGRRAS